MKISTLAAKTIVAAQSTPGLTKGFVAKAQAKALDFRDEVVAEAEDLRNAE